MLILQNCIKFLYIFIFTVKTNEICKRFGRLHELFFDCKIYQSHFAQKTITFSMKKKSRKLLQ